MLCTVEHKGKDVWPFPALTLNYGFFFKGDLIRNYSSGTLLGKRAPNDLCGCTLFNAG